MGIALFFYLFAGALVACGLWLMAYGLRQPWLKSQEWLKIFSYFDLFRHIWENFVSHRLFRSCL
jgi:fucose permease